MQLFPSRASVALAWALLWRTWLWSALAGLITGLVALALMLLSIAAPQPGLPWEETVYANAWLMNLISGAGALLALAAGLYMACHGILRKRHFRTFRIAYVLHGIPGTGRAHAWHMARWLGYWVVVYSAPAAVPAFALGYTYPESSLLFPLRLASFWLQLLALHWASQPGHSFGRGRLVVTPQSAGV